MWKSAVILIWACLLLPAVFALPAISRAKRQRDYIEQELVAAPYGARPPSGPTAPGARTRLSATGASHREPSAGAGGPSDRQQTGYRTALETLSGAARAAQIQRNVVYDGGNQQEFRDQQPEYRNQQEGFRNQEPQFTNQQQEFRDNQLEFINQPTQYRNQQQKFRNQQQELRGNGLESITQQPQYRDQQQQLIEQQPEAYNPAAYMQDPARYEFQWGVKNADGADFGHREARSGDLTEGSYYVLLPDTRTQTVNYRVDGQSGFVADVRYEGQAQYPRGDGETSQYRQREAGRQSGYQTEPPVRPDFQQPEPQGRYTYQA
ncbi:Pro-resilin [Amphibalanus amphitrite]|uniref:Pro-resilin n=1 Tax=Amphibalanus amphitrite TaxID=1232801 RepID=A0A6A4VRL6_AMPAM|nr:Pro-resilin [Amphibalanus amphitrite]